jgi:hypothetical protein
LLWGNPSKTLAATTGAVNSSAHKTIAAEFAPNTNPVKLTANTDAISAEAFTSMRL